MSNVKQQDIKQQTNAAVDGLFSYISEAFDTGIDAARNIHKAGVELPLNILQGIGLPEDLTNSLKEKNEAVVGSIYGSVHSVVSQVGRAGVSQVNLVKSAVLEDKPQKRTARPKSRAKVKSKVKAKAKVKAKSRKSR